MSFTPENDLRTERAGVGLSSADGAGGSLSVNAAWAVLGNIVFVIGRILVIVVLTRFFPSDNVGQVLYAMAVVTPLSFLVNMELRSVFVTDTRNEITISHCLTSRIISNVIFFFCLLVICGISLSADPRQSGVIILLVGAIRAVESLADIYLAVLQKYEQMKRWSISQGLKTTIVLLWVVVMPLWTGNIIWMLLGWLITTILVVWFYDRPQAQKFMPVQMHWDIAALGRLVQRGFPLGLFVTLAMLNQQVAQYFIKHELGYAQVAYFGVLILFVNGATAVQNGINQAILPRLAMYYAAGNGQFGRLLAKALGLSWLVMSLVLVVVWLGGELILRLLFGDEYARYADLFLIVMVACSVLLTAMILGDAVVACHRFKSRLMAVALGLLVNVAICQQFMGTYGLATAAWAALVSSTTIAVICELVLLIAVARGKKKFPDYAPDTQSGNSDFS